MFPVGLFPLGLYPPGVYPGAGKAAGSGSSPVAATIDAATLMMMHGPAVPPGPVTGTISVGLLLMIHGSAAPAAPLPYDLVDAVKAWLGLHLVSGTFPGGVHYDYAGPSTDGMPQKYPYLVVDTVSEADDYSSDKSDVADGQLQFTIYAQGRTQSRQLGDLIKSTLEDKEAQLTFQIGVLDYFRQVSRSQMGDNDPGTGGLRVRQEVRVFRYLIETT